GAPLRGPGTGRGRRPGGDGGGAAHLAGARCPAAAAGLADHHRPPQCPGPGATRRHLRTAARGAASGRTAPARGSAGPAVTGHRQAVIGQVALREHPDDRLAMLMGCCHPALAPADRIALMLRFVGSLSTAEVAAALLVPVPTMAARITRAKKRIATNRIPLTVPEDPHEREHRLPLVLTAISLVFTEGYAATSGDAPIRRELTGEAIRLARITRQLLPA